MGSARFCALRSNLPGYFAEYQPFKEGVTAESICAVQAGGGYFAAGVKIFDICFSLAVSFYTSYHIVCAGSNRDEVVTDIYIETFKQFVNLREPFCKICFIKVPNVQIDMG